MYLNTAKTGLLESYDQEISGFIDRNPSRDVKVRPGGVQRSLEKNLERNVERDAEKDVADIQCGVTPDRHHRWRIRLASGS